MAKHDLFSKRNKPLPDTFQYVEIPEKLRNQIVLWWEDALPSQSRSTAFERIRNVVCIEHGRLFLLRSDAYPADDLVNFFLRSTETDILLDIVELFCRLIMDITHSTDPAKRAIDELNHRFLENGVGYEFDWDAHQLNRIGDLVIHQEAVRPALSLLAQPAYKTANEEYLKAHRHFRNQQYDDCLTECCNAFESTIKIICDQKGWPCEHKDAAGKLVKTYMKHSGLPSYFETMLMIVATLRNKLGPHGKGTQPVDVPEHLAKYSLHATASAIVLLVDAAK